MRGRSRNLQARRRRWPLRLGLFLIYVLVQYVASARITSSETMTTTTTTVFISSSEDSISEPTESSIGSTEETSTTIVEEPRKSIQEKASPRERHGDAKAPEKNNVRGLSKEAAKERKETSKKETETSSPKYVQSTSTTVSDF